MTVLRKKLNVDLVVSFGGPEILKHCVTISYRYICECACVCVYVCVYGGTVVNLGMEIRSSGRVI